MTDPIETRIAACARRLELRCREAGAFVSGDGRVGEDVAAELLGFAAGTLANMRSAQTGPAWYRLGGGGYRVTYLLDDLARWIEATRCDSRH